MKIRATLRMISNVFLLAGGLLLGGIVFLMLQAHISQSREIGRLDSMRVEAASFNAVRPVSEASTAKPPLRAGAVLGELLIPRIGVDTVVLEGDNSSVLRWGAGHIPETALLDDPVGNVGIAAHRDTYFRPLRFIHSKELIILKTPTGFRRYRVQFSRVVEPNDVAVLDYTAKPTLTLVTCYPFYFIGSAPHPFIVRAAAVSNRKHRRGLPRSHRRS
jgi:sortase A